MFGTVMKQTVINPRDQRLLLVEDRLCSEGPVDDRLVDRATIATQECAGLDRP